ncbi:hypothetical protein ACQ86G_22705 [Roseateles chitinivorans]|uniref:hypothetical protein n=1 Tax=Roseateles chitinivorans TaxID=2917965 RepID=UPI003D677605
MKRNEFIETLRTTHATLKKGNVRPCLEIHLYGTDARGAFKSALAGAAQAVEDQFTGALRYYRTNTMSTAKAIAPDATTLISNFVVADEKKPAKLSGIEFLAARNRAPSIFPPSIGSRQS